MSFIHEIIKKQRPDIPEDHICAMSSVIERFISPTTKKQWEVYAFYKAAIKECKDNSYPNKIAIVDTMQKFEVTKDNIYKVCRRLDSIIFEYQVMK